MDTLYLLLSLSNNVSVKTGADQDEYVAHAGNGFEFSKNVLVLPPPQKYTRGKYVQARTVNEISQFITSQDSENSKFRDKKDEIKKLLEDIQKHIKKKITDLNERLDNSIESIHPDKFYKFSKGKGRRFVLNEDDFVKLSKKNL